MEFGAFSVSLAVEDTDPSRAFHEKSGFRVFGGEASQGWLVLKSGDHVIDPDGNPILVDRHV